MKALTVKQPWAGAIMAGAKSIENRTWSTGYRGTLAIHASASPMDREDVAWCAELGYIAPPWSHRGAVLGTVELVGVIAPVEPEALPIMRGLLGCDREAALSALDWWNEDSFGWVLSGPKPFVHPRPARGALKLWHWVAEP